MKTTTKLYQPLTPREKQIIVMIANGLASKEIGCALNMATKTVEVHRCNLMRKLDIHNVASVVRYAYENGLMDPPLTLGQKGAALCSALGLDG
jgi:two-component system response regulator NreC